MHTAALALARQDFEFLLVVGACDATRHQAIMVAADLQAANQVCLHKRRPFVRFILLLVLLALASSRVYNFYQVVESFVVLYVCGFVLSALSSILAPLRPYLVTGVGCSRTNYTTRDAITPNLCLWVWFEWMGGIVGSEWGREGKEDVKERKSGWVGKEREVE